MRYLHLAALLAAFVALAPSVRAEEDDDDPKSAHVATKPAKPEKPVKAEAPARPEPPAKPEPKPEAKSSKPEVKAAPPVAKPEPAKPEPAKPEPVKPAKKAEGIEIKRDLPKAEIQPEPPKEPLPVKVVDSKPEKPAKPAKPEKLAVPAPGEPSPPVGARSVRVRLVDGSTVLGTVRAELSEALVIDCNLGLLSIPRSRIAMVAYDAGFSGANRAPVQQLDDDLPPPAKKR